MNIALIADKNYYLPLETLLKSFCNQHQGAKIYILHRDIDEEWLVTLTELLDLFDNRLLPVKIEDDVFAGYKTLSHISDTTYYRLLIPEIIGESRILYLDSDMVIDGSLTPLYEMDLGDKVVGAVQDLYIDCVTHHYSFAPEFEHYFNAGMLLIDCERWRKEKITQHSFMLAKQFQQVLLYADQDILNLVLHKKWKMLPREYNVQVAARFPLINRDLGQFVELAENLDGKMPVIYHYTTHRKPWLNHPEARFSEMFWQYANLNWQDVWIQSQRNQR